MTLIKPKHLHFSTSSIATVLFFLISLFIIGRLYPLTLKKNILIDQQSKAINLKTNTVKISSLGQQRLISSLLWIETLLNSDLTHYESDDLQNWMFLRFKTITDLDPNFYEAYLYGGIYLSIIKDDEIGAKFIYERGLTHFPDDFYLNLNASFHYFYELHDIDKSLEHLGRIYKQPRAPRFLSSLYARLKSTRGDLQSALALLIDLYNKAPEHSELKKSYAHKIYTLKAEIDLNCLNSKQSNHCATKDFFGENYYLDKDGKYRARGDWKPFRIIEKAPAKKPGHSN